MKNSLHLFRPRASALFHIMTDPKSKGEVLSEGAKTYLDLCAKELFYGFKTDTGSKYTEKGIEVEERSIELLNSVLFTSHEKNTQRIDTDYLTGEPDIVCSEIWDVKSAWSLETFPATARAGHKKEYEWQMRAYMHLFDRPRATVAYCMVDTPDHLIGYEDEEMHIVEHRLAAELRVTLVRYERDAAAEEKLIQRCRVAQEYVREELFRIEAAHQH